MNEGREVDIKIDEEGLARIGASIVDWTEEKFTCPKCDFGAGLILTEEDGDLKATCADCGYKINIILLLFAHSPILLSE